MLSCLGAERIALSQNTASFWCSEGEKACIGSIADSFQTISECKSKIRPGLPSQNAFQESPDSSPRGGRSVGLP